MKLPVCLFWIGLSRISVLFAFILCLRCQGSNPLSILSVPTVGSTSSRTGVELRPSQFCTLLLPWAATYPLFYLRSFASSWLACLGTARLVRWWAGVLSGGVVFVGGVGSSPGAFPSMPAMLPRLNCAFNFGLPPPLWLEGAVQGGRVACLCWVVLCLACFVVCCVVGVAVFSHCPWPPCPCQ